MSRTMAYLIATVAGLALTIVFHMVATDMRGYGAVGGEIVFVTLPLWVWFAEMLVVHRR